MNAIRKYIRVNDNTISFPELINFNDTEVEVIVIPIEKNDLFHPVSNNKKILSYSGIISSGFSDTSENIDKLIYE